MPLKINPITGNLDLVMSPGGGTATTSFDTDIGSAVPTAGGVITFTGGTGIAISAAGNTVTIDSTGGFTWNEVVGTSVSMAINNGYILNNAALVTATLPATAAIGDAIQVGGKGIGLWTIAQNAGQTIHLIDIDTTPGVGGSLSSTKQYDCVELVCITANTDWLMLGASGNLTVV